MKIMQINIVYNSGSTGKIVYDIHTELKKNRIESIVCYGRGMKDKEVGVYKVSWRIMQVFNDIKSRFTGMPYRGSFLSTIRLLQIIKKEQPNIVHIHCINGFFLNIYMLVRFLKTNKISTVITHHAEFLYTGNCAFALDCDKWKKKCSECPMGRTANKSKFFDFSRFNFQKMKKAFENFEDLVSVSVSPWLTERVSESLIFKNYKNTTILNGVETRIFKPTYGDLRQSLGIDKSKKVILYVTSSFADEIKGSNYIIELADRLNENTIIIVVGNRDTPLIHKANIIFIGRVENQKKLAEYYTMADLTVLTSKVETFSMPVAESLCCGTPVVGFKSGGPESIALEAYSEFVDFGDIDALEQNINLFLKKYINREECSTKSQKRYNKEKMANEYIRIYNELFQKS